MSASSLTRQNLFRRNDIFTVKLKGAYYWNLNRKQLKDPSRNDTYLFGADFALNFPYMQIGEWARKYNGQTVYRLGYLNENISGDYGIHKLYGGVDYSVRNNEFVPSIRYSFDYNNYRDRSRAVNTALEIRRRHS